MLILAGTEKNIAWAGLSVCLIKHGSSEDNYSSGLGTVCTKRGPTSVQPYIRRSDEGWIASGKLNKFQWLKG
jgi:hypothetical protein